MDYRMTERGAARARSVGMTTPEELIGLVAFAEQAAEAAGLDMDEFLAGTAELVGTGYMRWMPDESAFAMLIPGEPDAGVRVYVPVPTVGEVVEAVA